MSWGSPVTVDRKTARPGRGLMVPMAVSRASSTSSIWGEWEA